MSDAQYTDETLTEDIRGLAQMLLDDPVLGQIMRDAGMRRNLTLDEEEKLFAFSWKQPFMEHAILSLKLDPRNIARPGEYYPSSREWGLQSFNPFLAAAVARHVIEEIFVSVNDPKATALIEENKITCTTNYEEHRHVSGYYNWQPRKSTFSEVYDVLKTIWHQTEVAAAVEHLNAMIRKTGSYDDSKYVYPAMHMLKKIPYCVMCNRGWSGAPILLWYIVDMRREQIDINDKAAVRLYIAPDAHVQKIIMGDDA
jgi:hypothetical protein